MNRKEVKLEDLLSPLEEVKIEHYRKRTDWDEKAIHLIPDEKLPYLGYIAAARVKEELEDRKKISEFLKEVAAKMRAGSFDMNNYNPKTRNKMETLLKQFNTRIEHGLFSPLFPNDPELIEKEASYLYPEVGSVDLQEMEKTQEQAYKNLSNYLSADFMDIYVATSMRSDADFISVNDFINKLFNHDEIHPLKLRYFNPTQSWIADRVAKGLVEALMLRRANFCIYMAQKSDTFGKDSEASVSLGQGKPVIVYVPKLCFVDEEIDSELFGLKNRKELIELIEKYDKKVLEEIDDSTNEDRLHATLLRILLEKCSDKSLSEITRVHWADFDLYGEIDGRIKEPAKKAQFRNWLNETIKGGKDAPIEKDIREELIGILIPLAIRFEGRAKVFRDVHPLALQIILSTGVLNGILVTRSVDSCAKILRELISNDLSLLLEVDEDNYKLIEESTRSTVRVISRHKLLSNAFSSFYSGVGKQDL
jgi:hypothetical protein